MIENYISTKSTYLLQVMFQQIMMEDYDFFEVLDPFSDAGM